MLVFKDHSGDEMVIRASESYPDMLVIEDMPTSVRLSKRDAQILSDCLADWIGKEIPSERGWFTGRID